MKEGENRDQVHGTAPLAETERKESREVRLETPLVLGSNGEVRLAADGAASEESGEVGFSIGELLDGRTVKTRDGDQEGEEVEVKMGGGGYVYVTSHEWNKGEEGWESAYDRENEEEFESVEKWLKERGEKGRVDLTFKSE